MSPPRLAVHVRRPWCVRLAVALVLIGAVLNLVFLFNHSPLDLGEDEAHYWEWSRHLDYGYYSKPPGIAWVIRGGVEFGRLCGVAPGDGRALMPFVRVPAILFSVVSGLVLLSLTRRIFRDDRAALASVLLSAAAPVFVVGSLLITIDAPMYMCWALSLWAFWRFVEADKGKAWLYLAAVFCALGMLFKPVLIAMPLCAAVAAWLSPQICSRLKTRHALGAILIVLASQIPVIVWNAQHDWVTFRHMGGQAGLAGGGEVKSLGTRLLGPLVREGSYIGGQIGILGGLLAVFLALAVAHAIRQRRAASENSKGFSFLLAFFLPLWLFYALLALWTNTEPNWPAAAYAAGMVLLAGVVTEQWNNPDSKVRRAWRGWITVTVVIGILLAALAMNMHRIYRFIADENTPLNSARHPKRWDPSLRLRGHALRADAIDALVAKWSAETRVATRVITNRYDWSSSLAFYMNGQPFVGCIMSRTGGRMNQYDLWPDAVAPGENVLFVNVGVDIATVERAVAPAFDRIDRDENGKPRYERVGIAYEGIIVRQVWALRCHGFRGWPAGGQGGRF